MLLFIVILVKGFSIVGLSIRNEDYIKQGNLFFIWSIGASLFVHTVTFISVSYYDQSFLFIYLTLSAIGSLSGTLNNNV